MQRKKYIVAFLVVAILGLAVRIYTPVVVGELFGTNAFGLKFLGSRLLLPAIVAAVAGYVLPKGFFLWGVGVVFLHPLVEVWQTHRANEGGAFGPSGIGDGQIFGLALLLVMMLTVYAFACTAAAALGAGLRLL